jgi:hypothetical protein
LGVGSDRRNYECRSEAQCRIVEFVCNHPEGSTCDETAAAAHVPTTAAHRVIRQLASRHLVRCDGESRWKADAVLLSPPSLCQVDPTVTCGDDGGWFDPRTAHAS